MSNNGKTHFNVSPVAGSVPFNVNGVSFLSTNVQEALAEARDRKVWTLSTTATTASGTKTLVEADNSLQIFTGAASGYSIVLPSGTTLFNGRKFELINTTSQVITVKDGSGSALFTLAQNSIGNCTLQSNSTVAGVWIAWQVLLSSTASGIINYNLTSSTSFATTSTTNVVITGFTLTPQAGTYGCWYNAHSFLTTTPKTHWWSFFKNGTKVADSEREQDTAHSNQGMVDTTMSVLSFSGSETIDVRVRTKNGTLTIYDRSMILIRLGT